MNKKEKNIIMITAGGVGQRFGDSTPKQYLDLCGKPVIEYVIDACKQSKLADEIVVVANKNYHNYLVQKYGIEVCSSGETLNITKRNGLDFIKSNWKCDKLVVVEAVRPTITSDTIDITFSLLDEYEAVACARKITDSLGHYGEWYVNREDYYTLSPPEGFKFEIIDNYFKSDSICTESIHQLPDDTKVYLNFDAPYFEKLTYPEDMIKLEAIMRFKK